MPRPPSQSLTLRAHGGKLSVLSTDCFISEAFDPAQTPVVPAQHTFTAIWDTGASTSVITQRVIDACGLKPIGPAITHGVGGRHDTEAYLVAITLLNQVNFPGLRVIRGDDLPGFDVLIGMDIITSGDFSITNKNGITVFSFRYPSITEVDYVQEHNQELLKEKLTHGGKKPDRHKKHKTYGKGKKRKR